MGKLRQIELGIGSLSGALAASRPLQIDRPLGSADFVQDQKTTLLKLAQIPAILRKTLQADILAVHDRCQEAKIEENDYTVLTYDDLEYELESAERGIRAKIAFVENQVRLPKHSVLRVGEADQADDLCSTHESDTCQVGGV